MSRGGVGANKPTSNPTPVPTRPTGNPTPSPTNPTKHPTVSPTFQKSFTCSYPDAGISGSKYGTENIQMCNTTIYACKGDTFTVGDCSSAVENAEMCWGDQYFVVQAYPYGTVKTVNYNDNCKYTGTRNKEKETLCASVSYTVPTADTVQCRVYGILLACGQGTCGGKNIPIYMPGNPTPAPIIIPTEKPTRRPRGSSLFDGLPPGADIGIYFSIVVGSLIVVGLTFVALLRLSPSFNHWFWSLEFVSTRFLGVNPPMARQEPKKTNLELWGYTEEEAHSLNYSRVPVTTHDPHDRSL